MTDFIEDTTPAIPQAPSTQAVLYIDNAQDLFITSNGVWQEILRNLVDFGYKPLRDTIARYMTDTEDRVELPAEFAGLTVAKIKGEKEQDLVQQAFELLPNHSLVTVTLDGEELDVKPVKVEKEKKPKQPKAPKADRTPKQARQCECGCGGLTAGGKYLPGHDSKHHSALLKRHDEGDEEATNYILQTGYRTQEQLDRRKLKKIKAEQLPVDETVTATPAS